MIPLTCDACDKTLKLRDELAGKKIKCPGCGAPLMVPSPDDEEDEAPVRSSHRREDDEGDGPSKPHPVFLIVGLALALIGLVATAGSIVLNHRNNQAIDGIEKDVIADNRDLRDKVELSKDQKESLKASIDSKIQRADGMRTSRYIVFAVVFGVIFLLGVGVRGYYFIAMKAWKAAHPDEGKDKKKKKKKKRRDE